MISRVGCLLMGHSSHVVVALDFRRWPFAPLALINANQPTWLYMTCIYNVLILSASSWRSEILSYIILRETQEELRQRLSIMETGEWDESRMAKLGWGAGGIPEEQVQHRRRADQEAACTCGV